MFMQGSTPYNSAASGLCVVCEVLYVWAIHLSFTIVLRRFTKDQFLFASPNFKISNRLLLEFFQDLEVSVLLLATKHTSESYNWKVSFFSKRI